jgi:hypothetical protein
MKCIVCNLVKGKRFCPAKNSQICASCCGEKRVLEIACPETCQYLSSGLSYQIAKKRTNALQHADNPVQRRKYYSVHGEHSRVLTELEEIIIRYAAGLRSLRDQHIHDAVLVTLNTYKTEQRGVIYEHTSSDPLVNSLGRELRQLLEGYREIKQGREFLRTGQIVDCLEVLLADVRYHQAEGADPSGYLKFIARSRPDMAKAPSRGLIIT